MLVGVTGNLGSGKTMFRRVLERFGYRTYDADEIVDKLYKDAGVINLVGATFGPEVIEGGVVNRKLLSQKVFNSTINLKKLNNIIHPLVRESISEIPHSNTIVFVEVPLLYEARMQLLFNKVILLRASHEACRKRALKRGFPEEEFEKRVAAQYAADRVERLADFIVDSECSSAELAGQAEKIIEALKAGQ